jgi:starch synthase (maltosyl-transferring)
VCVIPSNGTRRAAAERELNLPENGRCRVVVESLSPEVDCGRYAIKRVVGEKVQVEAAIYSDGHDLIACRLLYRGPRDADWQSVEMSDAGNDIWKAEFTVDAIGEYRYTAEAWIDYLKTWQRDQAKRIAAGQSGSDHPAPGPDLKAPVTRYARELRVDVERVRARYSTWYEFFPRSFGKFADCAKMLPYIANMGFDVVYLPPIHPVGVQFRKGRNNAQSAQPGDVGSPWAIGGEAGGHTAVNPDLGTLEDFHAFRSAAEEHGLEIALDLAFQCTPDHPWVREHPQWFKKRADGSIQYAENPPKKYQDIYPLDFESEDWQGLWLELKHVICFWIGQGVKIFRVDNPHTKAFGFWEWAIAEVKRNHPDTIFLAEAFTRPHLMYGLAKRGFSQSYTYFTWRNTKQELTDYFNELNHSAVREFFRPNLWPNTPDILPEVLQVGGRAAAALRLALAATLGANYGIYGPAFELGDNTPREPDGEEYLNSEKYEIKNWNLEAPESLSGFIAKINRIRRENPALHQDHSLKFHETDNPYLLCYSKDNILTVANLDWSHKQAGWVTTDWPRTQEATDLLTGHRRFWRAGKEFVELDPSQSPVSIYRIRGPVRTEKDFDYFA